MERAEKDREKALAAILISGGAVLAGYLAYRHGFKAGYKAGMSAGIVTTKLQMFDAVFKIA